MDTITAAVSPITIDSDRIIHEARCDLINRNIPDIVKIVQYDQTLPIIAVGLFKAGVAYALPSGAACNIRVKKPDGYVIYNPALGCNTARTVVYFEATNQMTVAAGEMHAIVEVVSGAKIAGTSPLRIRVEENPIQNDDIESEDEVITIAALAGVAQEARDEAVASASAAAGSATTASTKASDAASSASTASSKATAAATSASQASTSASNASQSASTASTAAATATTKAGEAAISAQAAAQSAASLNTERLLGDFATYQSSLTASRAYKVGEYLTYNGYLYKVTTAIASGGTITPGTNCVQTTVGDEVANNCLRFENVTVSATTGDIATITDARITADHVLAYIEWGNSSAITTDCTLTTSAGSAVINGTCTAATTATVTLVKKRN